MFYPLALARDRTGYIDWKRPSGAAFQPISGESLAGKGVTNAPAAT